MLTIVDYAAEFERRELNRLLTRVGSDVRVSTTDKDRMAMRKTDFVKVLGEDAMEQIRQRVRKVTREVETTTPEPTPEPSSHGRGCKARSEFAPLVQKTWYKATGGDMPWRDACIIAGTLPWGEIRDSSLTDEGVEQTLSEERDTVLAKYPGVLDLDV